VAIENKDVAEMLGEFFREASVLIFVFAALDEASKGHFAFWFLFIAGCCGVVFLLMGIVFEMYRG
jgi:hypothetical protein